MRRSPGSGCRWSRRGAILSIIIALSVIDLPAVVRPETTIASLNLFQRVARAPLIVQIKVRDGSLKYALVDVTATLKGTVPSTALRIAFRDYNLFRPPDAPAMVFEKDSEEILLLAPYAYAKQIEKNRDLFEPFGGPAGRFPLPAEGRSLVTDAVRRLVIIAAMDPSAQIDALWGLLASDNPHLLDASMQELDRMHAVSPKILARLVLLLQHSSPGIRSMSLRLIGRVFGQMDLANADGLAEDQARQALDAVLERARNDTEQDVRVAAVEAVVGWPRRSDVHGDLEAIARIDPDQAVRYVAQRALLDVR